MSGAPTTGSGAPTFLKTPKPTALPCAALLDPPSVLHRPAPISGQSQKQNQRLGHLRTTCRFRWGFAVHQVLGKFDLFSEVQFPAPAVLDRYDVGSSTSQPQYKLPAEAIVKVLMIHTPIGSPNQSTRRNTKVKPYPLRLNSIPDLARFTNLPETEL